MAESLSRLVHAFGGTLSGPVPEVRIEAVLPPDEAGPFDLALYVDGRYREDLAATRAAAVVTDAAHADQVTGSGRIAWTVQDPASAIARLVDFLCPEVREEWPPFDPASGRSVSPDAVLGAGSSLGPGCVVMAGARIGEGARLGAYSVIGRGAVLGPGCIVGPGAFVGPGTLCGQGTVLGHGAVVGSDGFGLRLEGGDLLPLRHVGFVILGTGVSIGARSVIARGTLGSTRIGDHTHVDAQVHVGHNVRIGRNCAVAAQVGIAGSARIGDSVQIGGQAGIADHIIVGDGARVAARSGVASNVPAGASVEGYPAMDRWRWLRVVAGLARTP